jgi:hypothetical protein
MGPEVPATEIDCNKYCRPVLSSERTSDFRIKKYSDQEEKKGNSGHGPQRRARHQERLGY